MSTDLSSESILRNIKLLRGCYQLFAASNILLTSRGGAFGTPADQQRLLERINKPQVVHLQLGHCGHAGAGGSFTLWLSSGRLDMVDTQRGRGHERERAVRPHKEKLFPSWRRRCALSRSGPLSDNPSDRAFGQGSRRVADHDWGLAAGQALPPGHRQGPDRGANGAGRRPSAAASPALAASLRGCGMRANRWRAAHRAEAQRRAGVVSGEVQRAQAISVLAGSAARVVLAGG